MGETPTPREAEPSGSAWGRGRRRRRLDPGGETDRDGAGVAPASGVPAPRPVDSAPIPERSGSRSRPRGAPRASTDSPAPASLPSTLSGCPLVCVRFFVGQRVGTWDVPSMNTEPAVAARRERAPVAKWVGAHQTGGGNRAGAAGARSPREHRGFYGRHVGRLVLVCPRDGDALSPQGLGVGCLRPCGAPCGRFPWVVSSARGSFDRNGRFQPPHWGADSQLNRRREVAWCLRSSMSEI